ncbi:phenylalanine--tRNA ligase alpha subunit, cytoplasmic-like [Asparagus officinalis]|uniref:phenylalanine--tRNA ligase alpha subunit, cytoplasmic-like n=1 Tax=Asparagus officinalis TaxID=4686 RepID=UPI00098E2BDF|nr:phenylalanine--tRNA ligase alpha subunit, cytoplasmic-like [Asparagus officinalis]
MAAEDSDAKTKAERSILGFLRSNDVIADSHQFASSIGIGHGELESVIKSLSAFQFIESQDVKKDKWLLTEEAKLYALNGSPEAQVFSAVPPEGIPRAELEKKVGSQIFKIGSSQAVKNKWVEIGKQLVSRKVENVEDTLKDLLKSIEDGKVVDDKDIAALKKRKLITLQTWKGYSLRKGPMYAPERKKFATDLTREHLLRGDWKDLEFKDYNLDVQEQPIEIGYLHPLLEVREAIQNIFLQMGFEEMPTNNFVESSFWNFDALFQPQQHPARDSHDTFFLKVPSTTRELPEDYLEKVKQVHEIGGYGSMGYRYKWKREEAEKNLLRTHTTAVSTRMLYLLAQKKPFTPKRYYSIDRVFRNEAVDRTHLAEFHQIEGLICDRNLTLGHLIGVLNDFFASLGMKKLRFKPAYNPYTEPSMEIFSYHEGLDKWVEVGNSGMFRPEMLRTMGFPEDVSVIAWGLSLERPTMILYGINNIRDLFGPKVDFNIIKNSKICRLGWQ